MKVQVRSLILLAVAVLLVRSQNQTETRYEDIISVALPQLLPGEEQAFRPILNQLEVETLNTEDKDQSEVSVRLTFPMQETFCSRSQGQPGKPCPLKKNGKRMMCSMKVRHPILEASNNLNTDLSKIYCEYVEAEDAMQQKIRTRRSKASICWMQVWQQWSSWGWLLNRSSWGWLSPWGWLLNRLSCGWLSSWGWLFHCWIYQRSP